MCARVILTLMQVQTWPSGSSAFPAFYLAFQPFNPLGSHPLPRKRECVQNVSSLSYAW